MGAAGEHRLVSWGREASGHLVVPAVFKTDVAEYLGQAGSIPVRLRHNLTVTGTDPKRGTDDHRAAARGVGAVVARSASPHPVH